MVGGGIHGVAIARDAAQRGLRVRLLEAGDLASGTSSRTSKLIHGGIRYLETGQFGLVREALRERSILLETAPTFVRPLPFVIPQYRGAGRPGSWIALGLTLYGAFAGRRRLREHLRLDKAETIALAPALSSENLLGGSLYWDAQMEDAPLCVAIAIDAVRAGAEVRTYTSLTALRREGGLWRARFRGRSNQEEEEVPARWIVNAAGPWADEVRAMALGASDSSMRRTRGTHLVLPIALGERALLLTARRDGRVLFAIPWGQGHTLVGTTDVDDPTPPGAIGPASADVRYLLEEITRVIPAAAGVRPVRAFGGLRSLARGRSANPWANSREHRLLWEAGIVTIVGGKYTTHRSLAERTVDRLVAKLGIPAATCRTATLPVGEGRDRAIASLRREYPEFLELDSGLALSEAEVVHAVRDECAVRLEDVLLRRTRLWLDARALRRAAEPAAAWMAPHAGWNAARAEEEVRSLRARLDQEEARMEEGLA